MNKNPEKFAIEYLIRNGFKLEEDYNNFARQVVNIAIEALEKQIPKKPTKHTKLPNDRNTYLCPTCNRLYWDKEFLSDWCSSCGQRFEID